MSAAGAGRGPDIRDPGEVRRRRDSLMAAAKRPTSFSEKNVHDMYTFPLKSLGSGMYGNVVLAEHKATGMQVALKIIRKKLTDAKQFKSVVNEINTMKAALTTTGSPNIVRIYDAYQDKHRIYIALELCPGGELFDRIVAKKKFSEEDASVIVRKLTTAIKAFHDKGIIHRDLKPENILLDSEADDAEVKITDFGLVKVDGEEDLHRHQKVGSPGYVSPQVLTSPPLYTKACDVWALGVITYVLVAGFPPFYGEDRDMFKAIKAGRFAFQSPWWDTISDAVKDLIKKMLTVDPDERITTEGILAHPWIVEHQKDEDLGVGEELRKTIARRRFRSVVMASLWGSRLNVRAKLTSLGIERHFESAEVSKMREAFYKAAPDGTVSAEQFKAVMTEMGFEDMPLGRMYEIFDQNEDGQVDYKEFLAGLSTMKGAGEEGLKMVFDLYDADNSGSITRDELARVLFTIADQDLQVALQTAGKIVDVFDAMDTNKDERVSFDEFKAGIERDEWLKMLVFEPFNASVRLGSIVSPSGEQLRAVAEAAEEGEGGGGGDAGASAGAGSGGDAAGAEHAAAAGEATAATADAGGAVAAGTEGDAGATTTATPTATAPAAGGADGARQRRNSRCAIM